VLPALRLVILKIRGLLSKRDDADFDVEMQEHLRLLIQRYVLQGMTREDATHAARRQFGNVTLVREQRRHMQTILMLESVWRDCRLTARVLQKSPAFTATVVITLALGLGGTTAIFSLMDQLLLRSLSVVHPDELVMFETPGPSQGRVMGPNTFSYPMYRTFRDENSAFSGIIASFQTPLSASINGQSERVTGDLVTGNYFEVLGVASTIGRTFKRDDDKTPGAHPVVMLSYAFWQRRFGGDRAILNRTLSLNGVSMTVVGVMPRQFNGIRIGSMPDVVVPVAMKAQMTPTLDDLDNRRSRWLTLMARLKPGVTREQAEAAMNVLYHQLNELELQQMPAASAAFKQRFLAKRLFVIAGSHGLSLLPSQYSAAIVALMGMVSVVLLIVCANVASLLMARGAARQKDVAVCLALGASRVAIARQRLIESAVLAFSGGALGLVIASWGSRFLLAMLPPNRGADGVSTVPDSRVIAFAFGLSALTTFLFGLVPALRSTRPQPSATLKKGATSVVGGPAHTRFLKLLIVAQVALSVLLLNGAVLFTRSLQNLRSVDPGFNKDRLLAFSVEPALNGYSLPRAFMLFGDLQKRLNAIPGVIASGPAFAPLMTNSQIQMGIGIEGYAAKDSEVINPWVNATGPGYFKTVGQSLIAGRDFADSDDEHAQKVAIINEAMAKYYFGDANPIGRRIGYGPGAPSANTEIVGVVKDAKFGDLKETIARFVYLPYRQSPIPLSNMTFYVRTATNPTAVLAAVRSAVQQVDPNLPLFNVRTMTAEIDNSLFAQRAIAGLSAVLGGLATLLAAIGLYGVMSYAVSRRAQEIGVRIALGAEHRYIMAMVLGDVAFLVGMGVVLGVSSAMAVGRLMQSQLFELSATDPFSLVGATVLLTAVAFLAGYLPARRATHINPILALRYE
jgi:predicted permease